MKRKLIRYLGTIIMSVMLVGQNIAGASTLTINKEAQEIEQAHTSHKTIHNPTLDLHQIESFSDDFFSKYMEQYCIPGGAVAIVQNGKVILQKGYGYSNVEQQKRFMTDQTSFSIASITKSFTAIAIMRLVEEGKVSLSENILTYLPTLKMDNPYGKPVTVEQLLTHTGGIDSSYTEDLTYEQVNNEEPHHLLNLMNKRGMKVVSRPGEFIEYSSYGTVLLGAIIEEVSGESCEHYIERSIIEPLQMTHTHMLNPTIAPTNGYIYNGKEVEESRLKGYFRLYPEGGLISTVEDMIHYMQMLLNGGCYSNQEVLNKSTLKSVFKSHARFDKSLPGMCYGFAEYENSGIRSIGHAGYSIDGTLSEVTIFPENNIGIFLVVNQGSNNNFQADFREAFVKAFLVSHNQGSDSLQEIDNEDRQGSQVPRSIKETNLEGTYRFSDYSKSNIYKANTFGKGEIEVKYLGDNRIEVSGQDDFTFKPYSKQAVYVGEQTYQLENEGTYMVFKQSEDGSIYMAQSENSSHGIYEKIKWYEQGKWQVPFFSVALIIYVTHFFLSIILYATKKIKKNHVNIVINSIALLYVGFFAYSMCCWGDRLRYTVPIDIYLNLAMPIVGVILTGILFFMIIREISRKSALKQKHVILCWGYYLSMLILCVIFGCFLNYWNFIGFKL